MGEALIRKRQIEDTVHNEVTVVKDTQAPRLAEQRAAFLAAYTAWRDSMIGAIAQQGFTL